METVNGMQKSTSPEGLFEATIMSLDNTAGKATVAFPDLRELTVWWESRYTEDRGYQGYG